MTGIDNIWIKDCIVIPDAPIVIFPPTPKRWCEIKKEARDFCKSMSPPPTFREKLSVYRQFMSGYGVFMRCSISNSDGLYVSQTTHSQDKTQPQLSQQNQCGN